MTKLDRKGPWVVPYKMVQMILIGCISRSRGQKLGFQNAILNKRAREPWVAHLRKRSKVTVEPIIKNPRGII